MNNLTIFDFLSKEEYIEEIQVAGSERQSHGFNYERDVFEKYNIQKSNNYTGKWDGFLGKTPVSVKTEKFGTDIELGDITRQMDVDQNFYMFVGFWDKNKNNIVKEYILYIDQKEWDKLFNKQMKQDFHALLKKVSNDREDDHIWEKKKKQVKEKWESTTQNLIRPRFKRDHKKQKRVQCAINFSDFNRYFLKKFEIQKPKGTTKSQGKKNKFDKFYTKDHVAELCLNELNLKEYQTIIEPSAGSGSFSNKIENCLAFDIEPEAKNVVKQDWFKYNQRHDGNVLVVGNPPFGEQNQLAVSFFNHAAKTATTIAFILPKSFKKESVQSRLDNRFHLKKELDIPQEAFTLNGQDYAVPTVFQVWEKRSIPRKAFKRNLSTKLFDFVSKEVADIRIPRVGGNAGKATQKLNAAKSSNYFIKNKTELADKEFVNLINSQNFPSVDHTTGPKSLPKSELITIIEKAYKKTKN